MEVMAEAHEQPASLNQDVDGVKKPRRTKTTVGVRKTTANKTGTRRTKKQAKIEKPNLSDANNHSTSMESQDGLAPENDLGAPEHFSPPSLITTEAAERLTEEGRTEIGEAEEPARPASVSLRETSPAVGAPRYESIFGERLIEVSGKGFGFLRGPKRNYTQCPQAIFCTPEELGK